MASCNFFYHTVSTVNFHVIYWQLFVVSDHNPDGVGTWQVSSEGGTSHASYTNVHPRHAAADQGSNCSVCVRACVRARVGFMADLSIHCRCKMLTDQFKSLTFGCVYRTLTSDREA